MKYLGIIDESKDIINKEFLDLLLANYQSLITPDNKLAYSLISDVPIFYNLTLQAGTFSALTYDPDGAAQTVNIPTTTSHISEGSNLYFTNARAVNALTDTLKAYVTLVSEQTITGKKDFTTGGLFVNGSQIKYDATNKYWKLEGDLLVTGGITMYGDDSSFTPSTIMDAITVDSTMYNEDGIIGVLKASTSSLGVAMFDEAYFSVDENGMVTLTNAPTSASTLGALLNVDSSLDATATVDRVLYQPAGSSTWTWRELPEDGVVGEYLPSSSYTAADVLAKLKTVDGAGSGLDADMLDGVHLSSIFYDTATMITADNVNSVLQNGTYRTSGYSPIAGVYTYGTFLNFRTSNKLQSQFYITDGGQTTGTGGRIYFRDQYNADSGITSRWIEVITSERIGVYNAGSATKLQTARTIWGQSFDGTGNVTGSLSTVSSIELSGTPPYIDFHYNNSESDYTNRLIEGLSGQLTCTGKFRIGLNYATSTDYNLHVVGSAYISSNLLTGGGVTMYSDIRKKHKLQDVELTLKQVADAPLIEHYYLSDQNKTTHVGSIAQYWAGLNDWFCKEDNEGYYTMEIQNAALASAISVARELTRYENKTDKTIRMLKKRICELEDEIEKLKTA